MCAMQHCGYVGQEALSEGQSAAYFGTLTAGYQGLPKPFLSFLTHFGTKHLAGSSEILGFIPSH